MHTNNIESKLVLSQTIVFSLHFHCLHFIATAMMRIYIYSKKEIVALLLEQNSDRCVTDKKGNWNIHEQIIKKGMEHTIRLTYWKKEWIYDKREKADCNKDFSETAI